MIQAIEINGKKDKRLPIDILFIYLKAIHDTLICTKNNPLRKEILQEIHPFTEIVKRNFSFIENKLTIIN